MNKHASRRDYKWPRTRTKAAGKGEQEQKNKVRARRALQVPGNLKGSQQERRPPCGHRADSSQNNPDQTTASKS